MFNTKFLLLLLPLMATVSLSADSGNDPFFNDPFGDDIFKEMMQMQQNMDQMFERMHQRMQKRTSSLVSPLGTYKMAIHDQFIDKGDHYELLTSIPESKENHIDINTANGLMSITAKIIQKQKTDTILSQFHTIRIYQQSISLPKDTNENTIQTEYKKGKLIILIYKKSTSITQESKRRIEKYEDKKTQENNISKEFNSTIKKIIINSDKLTIS